MEIISTMKKKDIYSLHIKAKSWSSRLSVIILIFITITFIILSLVLYIKGPQRPTDKTMSLILLSSTIYFGILVAIYIFSVEKGQKKTKNLEKVLFDEERLYIHTKHEVCIVNLSDVAAIKRINLSPYYRIVFSGNQNDIYVRRMTRTGNFSPKDEDLAKFKSFIK